MVQAFVPYATAASFRALVADCLEDSGYRTGDAVEETGAQRSRAARTVPVLDVSPSSTASALTWYERRLPGGVTTAVIVELDGRWDLPLFRHLSAISGGFVVVIEGTRTLARRGLAVFYAGRTIEAIGDDFVHAGIDIPGRRDVGGHDVFELFTEYFWEIAGGTPHELRWDDETRVHTLTLERSPESFHPYALDLTREPRLSRAAFGHTDERTFRRVVRPVVGGDAGHLGWRWLPATTPSSVPYVALQRDGDLGDALIMRLARALDGYAIGFEFGAQPGEFTWLLIDPDREAQRGRDRGAKPFIGRWTQFTVALGEKAGLVSWPCNEAGRSLLAQ